MPVLTANGNQDYSNLPLQNITGLTFTGSFSNIAVFRSSQFSPGAVSNNLLVTGSINVIGSDRIGILVDAGQTFSAAGWGFSNWSLAQDLVVFLGTSSVETITGATLSANAFFYSGGADILNGGSIGNVVVFNSPNNIQAVPTAGFIFNGASNADGLVFYASTLLHDFTSTTLNSVEFVELLANNIKLQFSSNQLGANAINTIAAGNYLVELTITGGAFELSSLTLQNWNQGSKVNIYGNANSETVNGTFGQNVLSGGGGNDIINGLEDNDTLYGDDGNDVLNGGEGADTLFGGAGADALNGGNGIDTVNYFNSGTTGVVFYLLAPSSNAGAAQGDTVTSIENVSGTIYDDRIYVDNTDNVVVGAGGFDTAELYAGNDTYFGGTGFDYVLAGAGNDFIAVAAGGSLIYGEDDNDTITATLGSNSLYGGGGNDTIQGGSGQDVIFGGEGTDVLSGNDAGDFIFGEGGVDVINGGNGADLIQGGAGNDDLNGSTGSDIILGGTENDRIFGSSDDDFLFGEDGVDDVDGGAGNDQVFGGNGIDVLNGADGIDFLDGGEGNDDLKGAFSLQELSFLIGGGGDDTLRSSFGQDQMWGGTGSVDTGNDVFIFGANNGFDIIFDFQAGLGTGDILRLSGTGMSSFLQMIAENRIFQAETYTQINLNGTGNHIFLANVLASNLVADDFLFA